MILFPMIYRKIMSTRKTRSSSRQTEANENHDSQSNLAQRVAQLEENNQRSFPGNFGNASRNNGTT